MKSGVRTIYRANEASSTLSPLHLDDWDGVGPLPTRARWVIGEKIMWHVTGLRSLCGYKEIGHVEGLESDPNTNWHQGHLHRFRRVKVSNLLLQVYNDVLSRLCFFS